MNEFVLITNWMIPAPIETVWKAIQDVRKWPTWWRYVKEVSELGPGDADGLGATRRFVWATRLPYEITFGMHTTRVQRPTLIEGQASGDLTGTGRWELQVLGGQTQVRYEWRARGQALDEIAGTAVAADIRTESRRRDAGRQRGAPASSRCAMMTVYGGGTRAGL